MGNWGIELRFHTVPKVTESPFLNGKKPVKNLKCMYVMYACRAAVGWSGGVMIYCPGRVLPNF